MRIRRIYPKVGLCSTPAKVMGKVQPIADFGAEQVWMEAHLPDVETESKVVFIDAVANSGGGSRDLKAQQRIE